MQPPALKTGHLSKFQLETLFYIFYASLKRCAAGIWHKSCTHGNGDTTEKALVQASWTFRWNSKFVYWVTPVPLLDINSCERRLFSNMQNITNLISPEDEVGLSFLARDVLAASSAHHYGRWDHVEAIELINHSTKLTTKYL
jgi:CCR4-NOT transcription complex subunit 2